MSYLVVIKRALDYAKQHEAITVICRLYVEDPIWVRWDASVMSLYLKTSSHERVSLLGLLVYCAVMDASYGSSVGLMREFLVLLPPGLRTSDFVETFRIFM